jgi:hypothetical protein
LKKFDAFVSKHLWWLVLAFAVVLLVLHSSKSTAITVDNTSIILLLLILLSPFGAAIKKIKFGGLEAEIDPNEVNKVANEAEQSLGKAITAQVRGGEIRPQAVEAMKRFVETDPVIALAKLRIELETRLRKLHERAVPVSRPHARPGSLLQIMKDLQAAEVLPSEMSTAIRDTVSICNRAIHGEDIRDIDAHRMIDVGAGLLEELDLLAVEVAATHPTTQEVISASELDHAQEVRYRVTTIVPLVKEPKRNVYEMTQAEMDEFFDGYTQFAEFVVRIEAI